MYFNAFKREIAYALKSWSWRRPAGVLEGLDYFGSGCAGIGALWALNRTPHDVYMYEAADRLGGHTNTVEFSNGKYKTAVDTGFIVLNTPTYRSYQSNQSARALS